jgi:hypothetical protein
MGGTAPEQVSFAAATRIGPVSVSALLGASHLAVHRSLTEPFGHPDGDEWAVSHIPTGYVLFMDFPTKGAALHFCKLVSPLVRWGQVKHGSRPRLKADTREAIREAHTKALLGALKEVPG